MLLLHSYFSILLLIVVIGLSAAFLRTYGVTNKISLKFRRPQILFSTNPTNTQAAPRVYQPRADFVRASDRNNTKPTYSDASTRSRDSTITLNEPQLLIRYRLPRVKSEIKLQLESLQETYRQQGDFRSPRPNAGRDSFFDNFESVAVTGDFKKSSLSKGKFGSKEIDRRNTDVGRARVSATKKSRVDDDDDDDAEYDEIYDSGEGYYGDESSTDLSVVPPATLRNMEAEGYSLEEIQMAVYGEYGVKASISLIKKKMRDDNSNRKSNSRTGKTRRSKTKERNARYAPAVDDSVSLSDNPIQVVELASLLDIGPGEIIRHLMMNMGIMASMTQSIEAKIAREVVEAFGKTVKESHEDLNDDNDSDDDLNNENSLDVVQRSPVVTIMGHVDHGKTTLLDSIRKAQVALGEAGGITQGISAFKVKSKDDKYITFIDTPGHAAFSDMRKRGANMTDIVILVVAADDGVMEQTKECIVAAKTAGCPIVVAVNKIDKEGANPQNVMTDLMKYDVLVEDFGGDAQCVPISAKKGQGLDELLEKVLLQAEVMNLKAPITGKAEGTIIEARVDKGFGVVATVLVQKGILQIGDYVLAGPSWGRVRRIISDQGVDLKSAEPSTPVQIVGMGVVPNAGDILTVCEDEGSARDVAEARNRLSRLAAGSMSNAAIKAQAQSYVEGNMDNRLVLKVPILIKADSSGSADAIRSTFKGLEMSDDEAICQVDVVYSGVGEVTSSDVSIAAVSKAKIVAFNVASNFVAMEDARASNVEIGYYNIVYELFDEIENLVKTTLAPPPPGALVGQAEIKQSFRVGKVGRVAGCSVLNGIIRADSQIRIMRGKRNPIYTGTLSSLKVVKDSVAEVPEGSDCGMSFDDFQDFEVGDIIECFVTGNV